MRLERLQSPDLMSGVCVVYRVVTWQGDCTSLYRAFSGSSHTAREHKGNAVDTVTDRGGAISHPMAGTDIVSRRVPRWA